LFGIGSGMMILLLEVSGCGGGGGGEGKISRPVRGSNILCRGRTGGGGGGGYPCGVYGGMYATGIVLDRSGESNNGREVES
jgi:hypothetical protein